ncbi:MAG: glucose-6-phosphate isomerase [Candidatus Eisenbacteria bacterium]|nr:glucose-6-phosphate isomerase [Candidatus Eisenbacteria bacterium]
MDRMDQDRNDSRESAPQSASQGALRNASQSTEDVRVDLTGVFADEIGPAHGLTRADVAGMEPDLQRVAEGIRAERDAGDLEPLDLPFQVEGLDAIREAARACREQRNFVILGIGGSALGARAIFDACLPPMHNLLPDSTRSAPRVFVAENVDPESLDALLAVAPPEESIYNVVSKSGTTIETLAQLLVIWDRLRSQLGPRAAERLVLTTDPEHGFLRQLARETGARSLPIPSGVGGRFSVLTAVGLLPAAVAGIDPEQLLEGAARMDERCRSHRWQENPALALAGVHVWMDRIKGKQIAVLMPYADALRSFAEWFCQLWAESLGKRETPTGTSRAPVGQTPVRAVGATDQHSQLQLYVQGPNDKLITTIAVRSPRTEVRIPQADLPGLADAGLDHVAGHGVGELLALERSATEMALLAEERPVIVLDVPSIGPFALGQLFQLYEWATIAAGMLYHVSPFDQPGVEEGKRLTHAAMGRSGMERERERIRQYLSRTDRFRV